MTLSPASVRPKALSSNSRLIGLIRWWSTSPPQERTSQARGSLQSVTHVQSRIRLRVPCTSTLCVHRSYACRRSQMNKFFLALALAREPIDGHFCPALWHRPGREGLSSRCQAVLAQVDGSKRFYCTCLPEGKSYQATSGLPRRADQTWALAATACPALHDTPLARDTFVFD